MPKILRRFAILCLLGLCLPWASRPASALELFAKGSISKNYFNADSYIISVSGATGLAFTLIPGVRLEGRYTNSTSLQNALSITSGSISGTLNDIMTQTSIYSVGVDFDLLGPRAEFQPFLYVGVGYVTTERSYYFLDSLSATSVYLKDPVQTGVSGNLGAGFRLRIANAFAFEAEAFAYVADIYKAKPLINVFGSVGVRIFM